jgi:Uncharacterized protein conserved in bacteria (DUF2188)
MLQNDGSRARIRLYIVAKPSGWMVEGLRGGETRAYKTQREAVAAARRLIEPGEGGEIVVQGRDGRIRAVDTFAIGSDSFDRISAVEGIFLSEEMKRDFRTLDRKRLSPRERREWLIAKYGPARDDVRRRK